MDIAPSFLRCLELALAFALFLSLIQEVKYRDFDVPTGLSFDDLVLVSLLAALVSAPSLAGYTISSIVLAGLASALFAVLWLDSILFRIFTIELGTGGLGTVVLSALYRELAELALARRFFAANRAYALLPILVFLASMRAMLFPRILDIAAFLTLGSYFAINYRRLRPRSRGWVYGLAGALWIAFIIRLLGHRIGLEVAREEGALPRLGALGVIASGLVLTKGLTSFFGSESSFFGRPSRLRQFLRRKPCPPKKGFRPRDDHQGLATHDPRPPRPSARHGAAERASVILVTFESMGTDHLAAFSGKGASAPLIERLLPNAVRSSHHFCVSPNTNNAHLALYASAYSSALGYSGMTALQGAGYRAIYMSAIKTENYGLRPLLINAGFDTVIDHHDFVPHPLDRGVLSDYALMTQGPRLLERSLAPSTRGGRREPFFLHVHTTNTHIPYRVIDPERFNRFDSNDDQGRFLNGLEEADWIVSELLSALRTSGLVEDPLILLSGDHGQAFGEWPAECDRGLAGKLGYQSHGSSVINQEIEVPFLVQHPRLSPGMVRFSSHFDVLPTVLDLAGIAQPMPCFGESIFHSDREPCLLLWAGHPSRAHSSSFGLVHGDTKLMVDLIANRCWEMDWRDRIRRELAGDEKAYIATLIHRALSARGLT